MGPMAGIQLHQKLVLSTDVSCDQEHHNILHLSFSHEIGDRTDYLLNYNDNLVNPGYEAASLLKDELFNSLESKVILGIPCNTFHSPKIFNRFEDEINNLNINVVNMIDETINYIKNRNYKNVGYLSTRGTKPIFNDLIPNDINPIIITEELQEELDDLIQ